MTHQQNDPTPNRQSWPQQFTTFAVGAILGPFINGLGRAAGAGLIDLVHRMLGD